MPSSLDPRIPGLATLALLAAVLSLAAKDPTREPTKHPPLDVLVVAPHSDDEAIGCTGVMLRAIDKGERVGVVVVSNGDGFPRAAAVVAKKDVDQLRPDDYLELAKLRQKHTLKAMGQIGVRREDLMFLAYPDSGLAKLYESTARTPYQQSFTGKNETYPSEMQDYHSLVHGKPAPYLKASVIGDLEEIIRTRKPKILYVVNEADSHADHRATFWFTRDAAKAAGFEGKLLTYIVHGKPPTDPPTVRLALTPMERERKKILIEIYQQGVSPIHDSLAEKYALPEEVFWQVSLK